jgi:hypothetical protein
MCKARPQIEVGVLPKVGYLRLQMAWTFQREFMSAVKLRNDSKEVIILNDDKDMVLLPSNRPSENRSWSALTSWVTHLMIRDRIWWSSHYDYMTVLTLVKDRPMQFVRLVHTYQTQKSEQGRNRKGDDTATPLRIGTYTSHSTSRPVCVPKLFRCTIKFERADSIPFKFII